ncbi:hypothetical protein KO519_13505 [Paraglaciecola agarilytica]|uniref:hypothetical protein n=1 Tax=Paraglaciecola chathamensis TaxID=368405 RepID=UPI001C08A022|nr:MULTISPECIES: hypothetical protein [Paraglaciecola]MBU3018700.1 hypothetical protein [Paraglaciecola agarilytica]MDO6559895.1 hypothetical protein [Paraglaciecola chathamensis]MDO6841846.1 hypothetical protein [Paraglaciecola chathamensis]
MRAIFLSIILTLIFGFPARANYSIIVVANTENRELQLNRQQVRNLFMGGALPYNLEAIALPPENQTRVLFNTKVVGLTESRIQSYWAQMRFTGRKKEPKEIGTEQAILNYIKANPGTVGYLPGGISIPDELTVLYSTP